MLSQNCRIKLAARASLALSLIVAPLSCSDAQASPMDTITERLADAAKGVQGTGQDVVDKAADAGEETIEAVANWKDAGPVALRERKCAEAQGRWVQKLTMTPCDNGTTQVDLDGEVFEQRCGPMHDGGDETLQCVAFDDDGRVYFNDGPSVPPAMVTISGWLHDSIDQLRYEEVLWQAGVDHDHCYHSNPISYGLSKSDCDERFIADLEALCMNQSSLGEPWFHNEVCRKYSALMYGAVRAGGQGAWAAFDTLVSYPQGEPMWQQLGLSEDPFNESVKDDIDSLLIKFKIIDDADQA